MLAFFKNPKKLTGVLFLFFSALHLFIAIANHYLFRTFAYDYAVYNFAFYDFAHLRVSPCTIYHDLVDVTFFQDHFSLTLIILAPFYWLLSPFFGSYSLLIIQWAAIIWGAHCTYKFIMFKQNNIKLGLFALIYYFILYGRYCSYQADCNIAIIGSALVPVFIYYFQIKKYFAALLIFIFLLFNREDFPLYLSFVCLGLMIVNRKNKTDFKIQASLTIVSILVFLITFNYLIPAIENENKKFSLFTFSVLGANPYESLLTIIKNPVNAIKLLFCNHLNDPAADWIKAKFYLVYGISGGLLLIIRPKYLVFLIPLIAKKMYNDNPNRWGYEMYYSVEVVSILPILVFSVISEFKNQSLQLKSGALVVIITTITSLYCLSIIQYPGISNYKFNFLRSSFYKSDVNVKGINLVLSQIPDDAGLSSSGQFLSHLAMRKKIYFFPNLGDAEYICMDINGGSWPFSSEVYTSQFHKIVQSPQWKALYASGSVILFKKIK